MTEYELEYEFLMDDAYRQMVKEVQNNGKISTGESSFSREFEMDEDDYQMIKDIAENGEEFDFGIPRDAPEGKRLSEPTAPPANDFVPVNMEEEFPT